MQWLFEPLDHRPEDADVELPPMDHAVGGHKTSQYSDAAARVALARAARGETIAAILAVPGMPSRRTLYDWIRDVPRFGEAWRGMRDRQALARQSAVQDAEPLRAIHAFLDAEARGRQPGLKRGRKSTYTRRVAEAWCELIADGATLREAAARPGMPAVAMIYRWLRNHPEFRDMYKAAAEFRDMVLREEAVDLAGSQGAGARGPVDALRARADALRPDVWR
jgi:hypothetical protein